LVETQPAGGSSPTSSTPDRNPSTRYVAPFAIFFLCLAVLPKLHLALNWQAPLWVIVLAVACFLCWPRRLPVWPKHWLASTGIGVAVFMLWIAPDVLIPGYRQHALFSNTLVGHLHSSLPPAELHNHWLLAWRTARAVLVVPVLEELFWRAWLMRWLINTHFEKVPLGTYTPFAFWVTAVLFASEHGPYWDVGLLTGIVYNLWMIRTKSVADCILMHAVTNLALSGYVIATAQWQYWQ
jgi:CAAX prenyl protease-like protein